MFIDIEPRGFWEVECAGDMLVICLSLLLYAVLIYIAFALPLRHLLAWCRLSDRYDAYRSEKPDAERRPEYESYLAFCISGEAEKIRKERR